MENQNRFKEGEMVICLPGFNTNEAKHDYIGAGAGYRSGKIFVIAAITEEGKIAWPVEPSEYYRQGVYVHALGYYLPEEQLLIRECNKIKQEIGLTMPLEGFDDL